MLENLAEAEEQRPALAWVVEHGLRPGMEKGMKLRMMEEMVPAAWQCVLLGSNDNIMCVIFGT